MNEFKLKEGLILTYEQEDEIKVENKTIKIIPVWKWLLDKES
jgi:predicted AAA+ superfamily ATPase